VPTTYRRLRIEMMGTVRFAHHFYVTA